MSTAQNQRREFLRNTGILGLQALTIGAVASRALAAAAEIPTPAQTEGPFYPVTPHPDKDADLTIVKGHTEKAAGKIVDLDGVVLDVVTGNPIANAMVEFWQACATGKYDHPEDPNEAALDPHFQYFAQVRTDLEGRYRIRTIKPGAYPASPTWMRPPHIHVKVHATGYPSLTTQLYFAGDRNNAKDSILQALTPAQQKTVVVKFAETMNQEGNPLRGSWIIRLKSRAAVRARATIDEDLVTPFLD